MGMWMTLAMIIVAIIGVSCDEKTEEEKAAEALAEAFDDAFSGFAQAFASEGMPTESRDVKPAKIGDSFRLLSKDATISFDEILWHAESIPLSVGDSLFSSSPDPGHQYLVVKFTIINGSEGDVDPSGIDSITKLEDELGRQNGGVTLLADGGVYEQIWDVAVANVVRPGRTGRGILFFDVDPDSPGLLLRSDSLGFEIEIPSLPEGITGTTPFSTPLLPDQGRSHIEPGSAGGPYGTRPAASGSHWITDPTEAVPTGSPARWGAYGRPLPDEVQIHNLEHGGIILNYNCAEDCSELVDQLKSVIPGQGAQFILAPYPNMPRRISITAWRHQDQMDEYDADRLYDFIDAYLDRAPESVPGNLF